MEKKAVVIKVPEIPKASDLSFARRTAKNVISGTISGIAGCIVGHPFDTLKVNILLIYLLIFMFSNSMVLCILEFLFVINLSEIIASI